VGDSIGSERDALSNSAVASTMSVNYRVVSVEGLKPNFSYRIEKIRFYLTKGVREKRSVLKKMCAWAVEKIFER
jgi:hypothetical protein